jgi:hypothetical protein
VRRKKGGWKFSVTCEMKKNIYPVPHLCAELVWPSTATAITESSNKELMTE